MSLFSSISPVSLLATSMMGPMGGIVAQLAQQVMSQMGQQVIQQMGQQLGLPQSAISGALLSFSGAMGDVPAVASGLDDAIASFGEAQGASPLDIGRAQGDAQDAIRDILNNLSETDEVKEARSGGRGGSWLRAMAEVLGQKLDASAHEMQDLANRVTKDDPSTTTDFNVVSQEFNMLMNAATTAIKTIGEGMGKAASRQ